MNSLNPLANNRLFYGRGNAPKTKSSEAYERIYADIVKGRFKAGEKLVIDELREQYGVGLGPLREALARLSAGLLVVAEDQRGFRVSEISEQDLMDTTELRCKIESWAIRDSIKHGDTDWEADVLAASHRLAKSPWQGKKGSESPSNAWADSHREFHYALVSACGSPWLLLFRNILFDHAERYRNLSIGYISKRSKESSIDSSVFDDEHKQLADAALARDSKTASKVIVQHYRRIADAILAELKLNNA